MGSLAISTVDIYLTGTCNYACGYCYGEDDRKPHMTSQVYAACLDFAREIGATTIELCGGEPLLSPIFRDATLAARREGFDLILRTNAIFLNKHVEFVAEHFKWVGVSLDGMVESNGLMRPSKRAMAVEDQFERPIQQIRILKELNPNIQVLLATVASAVNHADIANLARYIKQTQLPLNKWKIYQFLQDKFRSAINHTTYTLNAHDFDMMCEAVVEALDGAVPVQFQSDKTEGVTGNCLLVFQDGSVRILGEHYGQLGVDKPEEIAARLANSPVVNYIRTNKNVTYHTTGT